MAEARRSASPGPQGPARPVSPPAQRARGWTRSVATGVWRMNRTRREAMQWSAVGRRQTRVRRGAIGRHRRTVGEMHGPSWCSSYGKRLGLLTCDDQRGLVQIGEHRRLAGARFTMRNGWRPTPPFSIWNRTSTCRTAPLENPRPRRYPVRPVCGCARSSIGQSTWLRTRGLGVRVSPGAVHFRVNLSVREFSGVRNRVGRRSSALGRSAV